MASNLQDTQNIAHTTAVYQALQGPGVALITLNFPDDSSEYLRDLVLSLGKHHNHGPPIEHSSTRGWFWDVRPKEKVGHQARSESNLNFPWHTDCSYESCPPQFFGLHVIHADRYGGGTLSALNASRVLDRLNPSAYESLSRPNFRIEVPPEFSKGTASIDGSVISQVQGSDDVHIRFRADIIQPLSERAGKALQELNGMLCSDGEADVGDIRVDFTPQDLPDNTLVLMDNSRWLHSRTEVKDPRRHLRRIRWGRRGFGAGDTESAKMIGSS